MNILSSCVRKNDSLFSLSVIITYTYLLHVVSICITFLYYTCVSLPHRIRFALFRDATGAVSSRL